MCPSWPQACILPGIFDACVDPRLFHDVQGVEVGAQADCTVAPAAAEHADDAGLRKSRVHLEPERLELADDEGARCRFLERRLRMRVEVVAPRLHLGNERGDFGGDSHGHLLRTITLRPAMPFPQDAAVFGDSLIQA